MFVFHIATHDNKKALLSIRVNGEEVASVFDQNHKDNHKNSMAGTTIGKKNSQTHIGFITDLSSLIGNFDCGYSCVENLAILLQL